MYIHQTLLTQELSAAEVLGGGSVGGTESFQTMSTGKLTSIHPVQCGYSWCLNFHEANK